MSELFISRPAFHFGQHRSLSSLADVIPNNVLEGYMASGLSEFTKLEGSVFEHCGTVAGEALQKAAVSEDAVTDVIFITSTKFVDKQSGLSTELSAMCFQIGMNNAKVYAMSAGECGSFVQALRFSQHILQEKPDAKIMLLFGEKIQEDGDRDLTDITILSDGVAACLVSAEKIANGYQLLARAETTDHRVTGAYMAAKPMEALQLTAGGLRKLTTELFSSTEVKEQDVCALVTNNYAMHILKMFCTESGLPTDKLNAPTLAKNAHAFAIDNLLNLENMSLKQDDQVMCLSTGIFFWGACIMRYHA